MLGRTVGHWGERAPRCLIQLRTVLCVPASGRPGFQTDACARTLTPPPSLFALVLALGGTPLAHLQFLLVLVASFPLPGEGKVTVQTHSSFGSLCVPAQGFDGTGCCSVVSGVCSDVFVFVRSFFLLSFISFVCFLFLRKPPPRDGAPSGSSFGPPAAYC